MENQYQYFKRDISWLSFNYRVLLEAEDDTLPLYERINFISIYSSNLEEFYKIRVADHKAIATGAAQSDEETVQSAIELVDAINLEVNRQMEDRIRIYEQKILPALKKNHIIFYQSRNVEPFTTSCGVSSGKRFSRFCNLCLCPRTRSFRFCAITVCILPSVCFQKVTRKQGDKETRKTTPLVDLSTRQLITLSTLPNIS